MYKHFLINTQHFLIPHQIFKMIPKSLPIMDFYYDRIADFSSMILTTTKENVNILIVCKNPTMMEELFDPKLIDSFTITIAHKLSHVDEIKDYDYILTPEESFNFTEKDKLCLSECNEYTEFYQRDTRLFLKKEELFIR